MRERELRDDATGTEPGLHLDLHDGGYRVTDAAVHLRRVLEVAAPEHRPDPGALQVHRERGGRVERERTLDQLLGSIPLAEREERIDGVRGEDDARAPLDALRASLCETLLGELDGLREVADEVVLVGGVHPVPEQRRPVALGDLPRALQESESDFDLAALGAADAQDVRGDRRISRRPDHRRDLERPPGRLDGVVETPFDHEAARERGERRGTEFARARIAEHLERLLEQWDRTGLAHIGEVQRLVSKQPGVVRIVSRALGERRLHERQAPLTLTRVAEMRRRATHELELVHSCGCHRVGHHVPQAERPLAELGGGGVRTGGTRLAHGLHRGGERFRGVVRAEPVIGDLGGESAGACRGRGFESLRISCVESRPLAGQDVVEDRLPHQRVAECVVVAVDGEHAEEHGLPCGGVELVFAALVHLREHRVRDAHAAGGDEAQQLLRRLGQSLVAGEQQLTKGVGYEALVAASVDADELLDEERHAVAAAEHRVERALARRLVDDERPGELANLTAREPRELTALHPAVALRFGEEGAYRMPPRDVFGAVAQHREHPARAECAHEEAEQCQARRVDPVQVLDDEDDGTLAREGLEEHRDRLVQLAGRGAGGGSVPRRRSLGGGCPELGKERDEGPAPGADGVEHTLGSLLGDERAQRGLHRRVRRCNAAEVDALPGEQAHVTGKAGFELADEPCLADARLATDDDGEGRARPHLIEALVEPREVGVATDHGRC